MSSGIKVYKIRNKEGLFSKGGTHPYFDKKGKTWASRQALSGHLAQLSGSSYDDDVLVVEYLITTAETNTFSVNEDIRRLALGRTNANIKLELKYKGYRLEAAKLEFEKAKRNLENV